MFKLPETKLGVASPDKESFLFVLQTERPARLPGTTALAAQGTSLETRKLSGILQMATNTVPELLALGGRAVLMVTKGSARGGRVGCRSIA